MYEDIPAPYDNRNGSRTLTEAMRELQTFRATRKAHDLSVLPVVPVFKHNQPAPEPVEEEQIQEAKKPKRKK